MLLPGPQHRHRGEPGARRAHRPDLRGHRLASWDGLFDLSREAPAAAWFPWAPRRAWRPPSTRPIAAVTFTLEEILGDTAAKPLGSIVIASVIASVVERWILGEHAAVQRARLRLNSISELPFYLLLGLLAGRGRGRLQRVAAEAARVVQDASAGCPPGRPRAPAGCVLGVLGSVGAAADRLRERLRRRVSAARGRAAGLAALEAAAHPRRPQARRHRRVLRVRLVGRHLRPVPLHRRHAREGWSGSWPALLLADPRTQPGAFALVGMGAVFAGIVRAPITSIVIIFEMTNNYSVILPLMAANITSYALASRLSPAPIYDALLMQDGLHLPHRQPAPPPAGPDRPAMTRGARFGAESDETVADASGLGRRCRAHKAYRRRGPAGEAGRRAGAADIGARGRRATGRPPLRELARPASVHAHPGPCARHRCWPSSAASARPSFPSSAARTPRKLLGIVTMQAIAAAMAREAADETAVVGCGRLSRRPRRGRDRRARTRAGAARRYTLAMGGTDLRGVLPDALMASATRRCSGRGGAAARPARAACAGRATWSRVRAQRFGDPRQHRPRVRRSAAASPGHDTRCTAASTVPVVGRVDAAALCGDAQEAPAGRRVGSGRRRIEALPLQTLQHPGERAGMNVEQLRKPAGRDPRKASDEADGQPLRSRDADGRIHRLRRLLETRGRAPRSGA